MINQERFMPIQVIWYCEKCKSTMMQKLPNNPPSHCYYCAEKKFEEKLAKTGSGEPPFYRWLERPPSPEVAESLKKRGIEP